MLIGWRRCLDFSVSVTVCVYWRLRRECHYMAVLQGMTLAVVNHCLGNLILCWHVSQWSLVSNSYHLSWLIVYTNNQWCIGEREHVWCSSRGHDLLPSITFSDAVGHDATCWRLYPGNYLSSWTYNVVGQPTRRWWLKSDHSVQN